LSAVTTPVAEKTLGHKLTPQLIVSASEIFKNSADDSCAINSCSLKTVGCIDPYTGTKLSAEGLKINNSNVKIVDALAGYVQSVCISCTNGK